MVAAARARATKSSGCSAKEHSPPFGKRSKTKPAGPLRSKIIRVDLATDEVFNRFAREIRIAERLDHPHIARIYDSRIDEHVGYYAMELIDGLTLDKYVKYEQPKVAKILCLAVEVCGALDHAHEQGVVHRDLKPSNIMVTQAGARSS